MEETATSSGTFAPPDIDTATLPPWMADAVAADPRLRMVLAMMNARKAELAEATEPSDTQLVALRRAHAIARRRLALLAAAVGACPHCWGERIECDACAGVGAPGAFDPDPAAFSRYVMPVARRLRAARGAGAPIHASRSAPGAVFDRGAAGTL